MAVTLVLIRHAKSDWSVPITDRDRPLAKRGRKQAPATGEWIAAHLPPIDLAVVSVAARARQTWERVSRALPDGIEQVESATAYTLDGRDLRDLVASLPPSAQVVALVGHNPAAEELIEELTGEWVPMPTSSVAVIELPDRPAASRGEGRLRAAGRPADDRWPVRLDSD